MTRRSSEWTARGICAVVLAFGVTFSVGTLCVGVVLHESSPPQGLAWLATALGTLIGAVATYLGGHLPYARRRRYDSTEDDEQTPN